MSDPIDLKTLGLAALLAGAVGTGGGYFGPDLRSGEAETLRVSDESNTFRREVERDLGDVQRKLQSLDRDVGSVKGSVGKLEGDVRILVCIATNYEAEGCSLMRPRNPRSP